MSDGIATFLSGSIENFLATFVSAASKAVITGITPLVAIGMSIWFLTYGFAVMRNEVGDPVSTFIRNVLKNSFIFAFALSAGAYQSEIVEGVYAFQDAFVSAIAPQASGDITGSPTGGATNIYKVLDKFDIEGTKLALIIIGRGLSNLPFEGWADFFAGIIVLIVNTVMMLICLGFLILAKTAMAFLLAIGPAFIASLAFPPIARSFEAWFGKIMNYSFLLIGLGVVVSMTLTICSTYISHFSANQTDTQALADAFGLVVIEGALLFMLWQLPSIASGLGGGAALNGGGVGAFIGGMLMNKMMSNDDGDSKKNSNTNDGGEVKNQTSKSQSSDAGSPPPAYRKAALQQLEYIKHKDV